MGQGPRVRIDEEPVGDGPEDTPAPDEWRDICGDWPQDEMGPRVGEKEISPGFIALAVVLVATFFWGSIALWIHCVHFR